ncbi:MAG: fused MFS/spermidine synthase [Holophagales bacterium]|nr:fused MFS/spermidine synthase [Holophagales bacterium]
MIRLYAVVFLSGAALMGLEIAGSRIMAPVFGSSIFVWGALITTFLASLSTGYALGGKLADRRPSPALLGNILVAAGFCLWLLLARPAPLLALCNAAPVPERFRALLAALLLFALPSVLMGTVSPFATRLAARDVGSIGRTAGTLAAISTAGSIVGTFAMAFLLIPAFPIEPILFGTGAVLVLSGALASTQGLALRLGVASLGLFGAAGVFLLRPEAVASPLPGGTVVFRKETAYHRLLVVDQGPRRALYFDNFAQGMVDRASGRIPDFLYPNGLLAALLWRRDPPRNAFIIGLGAGMLPRFLSEKAPEIATTSVEIDPEVVRVAEKYFDFRPDSNDRVLVGDGRSLLAREKGPWDVIYLDAFFSDSVPFHLTTLEFFQLCRDRLRPGRHLRGEHRRAHDGPRPAPVLGHAPVGAAGVSQRRHAFARSRGRRDQVLGQRHPGLLDVQRAPLQGACLRRRRPGRRGAGPPRRRVLVTDVLRGRAEDGGGPDPHRLLRPDGRLAAPGPLSRRPGRRAGAAR